MKMAIIGVVAIAAAVAALPTPAAADNYSEAAAHFERGRKHFDNQAYREAIKEFRSADAIAPAPLNDFNIALSFDRLGDKRAALDYYRSYLKKAPNAPNRSRVTAKIKRLEGELRAASAVPVTPPPPETTTQPTTDPSAEPRTESSTTSPPVDAPTDAIGGTAPTTEPSQPKTTPQYRTGDPDLDRVGGIDIAALRQQRGIAAHNGSTAAAGPAQPGPAPVDQPKKTSKPIYKQWWFWALAGVATIIVIDVATSGDDNRNQPAGLIDMGNRSMSNASSGSVLLRF